MNSVNAFNNSPQRAIHHPVIAGQRNGHLVGEANTAVLGLERAALGRTHSQDRGAAAD